MSSGVVISRYNRQACALYQISMLPLLCENIDNISSLWFESIRDEHFKAKRERRQAEIT